MVAIYPTEFIY